MRLPVRALMVGLLGSGLARADAPPRPRYVTVHIDHVAPAKVKAFEAARRTWLAVLAKQPTTDGRGLFLQPEAATFFSLRPFDAFVELDRRRERVEKALHLVSAASASEYDRACDEALVPPHKSEIWRYEESLSYLPAVAPLTEETAGYAVMVIEELVPTPSGERYESAWKTLRGALKDAHHPITRVTFESVYGDGRLVTLWLARSKEDFERAPTVEAVAARALGQPAADALFQSLRQTIVHAERFETRVRRDLSSPPL